MTSATSPLQLTWQLTHRHPPALLSGGKAVGIEPPPAPELAHVHVEQLHDVRVLLETLQQRDLADDVGRHAVMVLVLERESLDSDDLAGMPIPRLESRLEKGCRFATARNP